jgi:hypothetical protein
MQKHSFLFLLVVFIVLSFSTTVYAQDDDSFNLTQTFDNGQYTFNYPEGWFVLDFEVAQSLATSESAAESEAELNSGDMRGTIVAGSVTELPFGLESGATAQELINALESLQAAPTCSRFSKPVAEVVNGIPITAAIQLCSQTDNTVIVADLGDDNIAVLMASASVSEIKSFVPTLIQVVASFTYGQSPIKNTTQAEPIIITIDDSLLTGTFSHDDIAYTVDYPDGWNAEPLYGIDSVTGDRNYLGNVKLTPPQGAFIIVEIIEGDLSFVYEISSGDPMGQGLETINSVNFEIDGRSGFRVDVGGGDVPFTQVTYALELDSGIIARMTLPMLPPNIDDVEPFLFAILASVQPLDSDEN